LIKIHEWEKIITEGKAKIIVPDPELFKRPDGVYEPAWAPVFYNPRAAFNRDVAMVFTASYFKGKEYFFVEPLAGCGIRSIRYVLESCGIGIANDIDPIAYYYMTRNIELNRVQDKLRAFNSEANTLLNSLRNEGLIINYIDIDPYGTPIPFIDSATYAIAKHGVIAVTATDTGPLNCSHPNVCYRRYNAICYKTDFSKEAGLRILIGALVRRATSHDVGLRPLLAYYHDYYYRVYFLALKSAKTADSILSNIGYILYDKDTFERTFIDEKRLLEMKPSETRDKTIIGPLWIGKLADEEILANILNYLEKHINEYPYYENVYKLINMLSQEYKINVPYYRYDKLFGKMKKNTPPINIFVNSIRESGYEAYRTHFDPKGVRTNMPFKELIDLIRTF